MANEILYAGVADLRTSEALSGEYLLLLADRNALPNHPALLYLGDSAGETSLTKKISQLGLMGYDLLAAVGDGSTVGNTALTDGSASVTLGRYSKSYERSDMARLSDALGMLSPSAFALDAVISTSATLVSLIANITDDFTATVGATGVNLSVANWLEAIATLEIAKVPPPYLSILHGRQTADLRSAVSTAAGGAVQWMPASQDMLRVLGNGYRGNFADVPIFSSSHVPTANAAADRAGGMFGRGAVIWGDSSYPAEGDPNQLIIGGKVLFERDREAKAGTTSYVTHAMLCVSQGIDAAGVSIITDA